MRSSTRGGALLATLVLMSAGALAPAAASPVRAQGARADAPAVQSQEYWLGPSLFRAADTWKVTRGQGVTVAVVDTGVQASLPELSGQVLPGLSVGGSGDGRTDSHDPDLPDIPIGHGTAMAALIAANGKGNGYIGLAPGAKILPVSLGQQEDPDRVATGIKWAVDHGAKVINLSIGAQAGCYSEEADAIKYAYQHDVVVVAAAGNEGLSVGSPASCPGALAVGAVDKQFVPYAKSNTGPQVDFVAPSANAPLLLLNGSTYTGEGGTSMATALVSAVFALVRAHFPDFTARQAITQVLWNVHNGLGGKTFAKRIDDSRGYGQPLPFFAVSDPVPATSANPISDQFEATFAKQGGAPSGPAGSASSSSSTTHASSGGGGSSNVAVILVAVLIALAVIVAIAITLARSRRPGTPGPPAAGHH